MDDATRLKNPLINQASGVAAMAITGAVPRDGTVYVLGSDGQVTATIPLGSDDSDGLISYTPSTVTVRRDGMLFVFGEDGTMVTRAATGG
jgi:hypothetical protein